MRHGSVEEWIGKLALVTGGAVFCVYVVHGDFEHVVATDADAMDFDGRFLTWFGGGVIGVLGLLCLVHGGILP
ncbi:MAG: hypothetical protein ACRD5M_11770 [Candidatus Acidiferrales bacterium]